MQLEFLDCSVECHPDEFYQTNNQMLIRYVFYLFHTKHTSDRRKSSCYQDNSNPKHQPHQLLWLRKVAMLFLQVPLLLAFSQRYPDNTQLSSDHSFELQQLTSRILLHFFAAFEKYYAGFSLLLLL